MNSILDYALDVEQITTAKRSNLILNVDGAIAVAFVDLLRESGQFSREESDKYVLLNLFMTARGFIFFFIITKGYLDSYIAILKKLQNGDIPKCNEV